MVISRGVPLFKLHQRLVNPLVGSLSGATDEHLALEGGWYGNDTLWRTVHDLIRALFYGTRAGTLADRSQREVLYIVDAVIAGEGDGPLKPSPRRVGVIMAGFPPAAVDLVASRMMGFDPMRIPTIREAFSDDARLPLATFATDEVEHHSNDPDWDGEFWRRGRHLGFRASRGWLGHVELPGSEVPQDDGSRPGLRQPAWPAGR